MSLRPQTILSFFTFLVSLLLLITFSLPPAGLRIVACDVGQGDAILILKSQTQVLIDGGPRGDAILDCLAKHLPFWDRTLELVVFTNTDYDHLNGLSSVLTHYQIGKIVTGDGVGESRAVAQFLDVLEQEGLVVSQVGQGDTLLVGSSQQLKLRVLWPQNPNPAVMAALNPQVTVSERTRVLGVNVVKNINERSVVLELQEPGFRGLFTGDIGEPTEKALLEAGLLQDIDILKVGHHGSKFSSSPAFLTTLMPEISIISVGAKNTYGHPTEEVISRLTRLNSQIMRTDQEGDIVLDVSSKP